MAKAATVTPINKAGDAKMLSPFEGLDVIRAGLEIPAAGGGLRESLTFDPREFEFEEEFYVVMKCKVKKVRYESVKDTDCLSRVHVADVLAATFCSEELADGALQEAANQIRAHQKAALEAQGIKAMVDEDGNVVPEATPDGEIPGDDGLGDDPEE